jgi:hypothetical protein
VIFILFSLAAADGQIWVGRRYVDDKAEHAWYGRRGAVVMIKVGSLVALGGELLSERGVASFL